VAGDADVVPAGADVVAGAAVVGGGGGGPMHLEERPSGTHL
jgi:hypothetical protein